MYVRDIRRCCFARVPFAPGLIVQLSLVAQSEDGLPHHAFTDTHSAVGTVVVMYGCALPRLPTENEQFGELVAKDSVARVCPLFEEAKGAQVVRSRLHAIHPIIHFCE